MLRKGWKPMPIIGAGYFDVTCPFFVANSYPVLLLQAVLLSHKTKSNFMATLHVQVTVNAPVEKVWEYWTSPTHIKNWNSASEDWHTPHATNDLREGGSFTARMEAKDGSMGFDFGGVYHAVDTHKRIAYAMSDGRKVDVLFESDGAQTVVTEALDAAPTNPEEFQPQGWQAILDNFRKATANH